MIKIEELLPPRIPPFVWNIIGYITGLVVIFYHNNFNIIIFSFVLALYGLLNILFDIFTVSFEYTNNDMPNYNKMNVYSKLYISNKKYILQNKNSNYMPFETTNIIDDSKLLLELSIYAGNNPYINNLLFYIYILGITNKNYTRKESSYFKDNLCSYL